MGRCKEFYDRWEQEPNWCEKCPSAVSQINNYLKLVNELEKRGVDRDFTFVNFSEGAARPILTEKDTEIKDKAFFTLTDDLKLQQERKSLGKTPEKITVSEVSKILREAKGKPTPKKEKKITETPGYERIPLSSALQWLEESTYGYLVEGEFYLKEFLSDFEAEMRKRHFGH